MSVTNFDAIKSLSPYAAFGLVDDDLDSLIWYEDASVVPCPSKEQIEAERARLQADYARTEYQRLRAPEYPPITEYLDGVVKGDQAQIQAYIDACMAVKAKYPKPA